MSQADLGPWVEDWLSAPRFGVYLTAASGDRALALNLYEWNTAVSAALLHDLAHLEVAVRNAYDTALVRRAPPGAPHWTTQAERYFPVVQRTGPRGSYDANERPRRQIQAAVREAGPGAQPGKVIAELPFGFWRYLSSSAHEVPLWRPYLHRAFIRGTARRTVDAPISRLHRLRNRVAHHEPLLGEDLAGRYGDAVHLAGLISAHLQSYLAAHSTWTTLLHQRPAPW